MCRTHCFEFVTNFSILEMKNLSEVVMKCKHFITIFFYIVVVKRRDKMFTRFLLSIKLDVILTDIKVGCPKGI